MSSSPLLSMLFSALPQLAAYLAIAVAALSAYLTYRAQQSNTRVAQEQQVSAHALAQEQVIILGKQSTLQELEALLTERRNDNQSLELKVEKQGRIIEDQGKLIEKMRVDMQQLTLSNQQLIEENRKLLEFIHDNEDLLVKPYMERRDSRHRTSGDPQGASLYASLPTLPGSVKKTKARGVFSPISPPPPPSPPLVPLVPPPSQDPSSS